MATKKSSEHTMIENKKIVVFMPARNTGHLLTQTYNDIPENFADQIILVDNASLDNTVEVAQSLGMKVIRHEKNLGYGGSLKTGYATAIKEGADVVVMLHSDNQYDPNFLPEIVKPILDGKADAVLGSRILGAQAKAGGMPWWKYIANVGLTKIINHAIGSCITEFHTGYRAYSRRLLENLPFRYNSDNFLFDTEITIQIVKRGFEIKEVPIPTRYFAGASTMTFWQCVHYGIGIVFSLSRYFLHKKNIKKSRRFSRIYEL
jgi:glycosyltransferase involved in cell wall biosynthesis